MRILGLVLVLGLLGAGCATFQHSETLDVDQQGVILGKYASNSQGRTGNVLLSGTGAGWEAGAGTRFGGGPASGAFGGAALYGETGPPKVSPINFARSIAMINYSKKLKSIKYDEMGGIIEYEFDSQSQPSPKRSSYQPTVGRSNLPSSFGHQPIE